jgi:hypothetical protein
MRPHVSSTAAGRSSPTTKRLSVEATNGGFVIRTASGETREWLLKPN